MQISNELIERFFSGNCTEEEKNHVLAYFKANPEKFDQLLTEKSWNDFNPDMQIETPSEKMLYHIQNETGLLPIRKMRYGWMAAASVILLAGIISLFYWKGNEKLLAKNTEIAKASEKKEEAKSMLQTISNNSSKTKTYSLPDKSKVELTSNSTVSFNNPFTDNRRDIYLKGEAVFMVMKDKTKPFIVHSKNITTTALGTVFKVINKNTAFITVQLYRGSIVVKKDSGTDGKSFKDIYLVPGQQLVIDDKNFSAQIKMIEPEIASIKSKKEMAKPNLPKILKFANEPLTEIFASLQKEYEVTISFDENIIQNMNFTGTLNKDKESLESFLNTLCTLNDLTLTKQNNGFSISQIK